MEKITVLGIDLAKNVFQLHGINDQGKVILKKKIRRNELSVKIAQIPPCLIGIEACSGSSYWAKKFKQFGHVVKVIPSQYVKPYVKTNKNDAADAEAICEAVTRPNMRFVADKSQEQYDFQMLHRRRSQLVEYRTRLSNQTRGFLAEFGIVIPKHVSQLKKILSVHLENSENELSHVEKNCLQEMYEDLLKCEEQICLYDKKISELHNNSIPAKRLSSIPGVGILIATALLSKLGDSKNFKNGRHFAAFLGLVPLQVSSGGKEKLLGISRRGDPELRRLLVLGARSVMMYSDNKKDRHSLWINNLKKKKPSNVVAIAVANKMARLAWALSFKNEDYCIA